MHCIKFRYFLLIRVKMLAPILTRFLIKYSTISALCEIVVGMIRILLHCSIARIYTSLYFNIFLITSLLVELT